MEKFGVGEIKKDREIGAKRVAGERYIMGGMGVTERGVGGKGEMRWGRKEKDRSYWRQEAKGVCGGAGSALFGDSFKDMGGFCYLIGVIEDAEGGADGAGG